MPKADKVIFRKYKYGDIIAIFPEIVGNNSPYTCQAYTRIGQHFTTEPDFIIQNSRAALPSEYATLKAELENLSPEPYTLKIIKRHTQAHLAVRRSELAKLRP